MFTGIIAAIGHISHKKEHAEDIELTVSVGELDMSNVQLGDSIAVNGVCLTVIEFADDYFKADASKETMSKTAIGLLGNGDKVNLEKALTLATPLGGHLVSGHVDGLGTVVEVNNNGRAIDYWIDVPQELAHYIATKGSITIDGISLTVNDVQGSRCKLTIIPHTALKTTLQTYKSGRKVNVEVDIIARYLERLMTKQDTPAESSLTLEKLVQSGFIK